MNTGNGLPVLSQIFVYPIKSARGIAVSEIRVGVSGPERDRRWMLVDEDGLVLTQRTLPRMALLAPRLDGEDMVVEAPGMEPLKIRSWRGEGDEVRVRIMGDELRVPHPDPKYSAWFSGFLGQPCRLVHLPDTVVRPVEAPYDKAPWRVSLADAYPLLVLGQASLDLLNEKLEVAVTVQRFRPNLVIMGSAAHEEDNWPRIRLGEVEIALVKACARCAIPLVDPVTAETGAEPLKTLTQYRKTSNKVLFAQNALVITPGVVRVGAAVEVVASEVRHD